MLFKGYGQVWNASKNKLLCTFENGEYETTNEDEITLLQKMNFKGEEISKETKNNKTELKK